MIERDNKAKCENENKNQMKIIIIDEENDQKWEINGIKLKVIP